ncbi:hypothetical protein LT493_22185 [Streptomyces tricolor]|nr:hypothetical protein [Streptomyces tricolor]
MTPADAGRTRTTPAEAASAAVASAQPPPRRGDTPQPTPAPTPTASQPTSPPRRRPRGRPPRRRPPPPRRLDSRVLAYAARYPSPVASSSPSFCGGSAPVRWSTGCGGSTPSRCWPRWGSAGSPRCSARWRWQLVARGLRLRLPLGAAVADYYRALFSERGPARQDPRRCAPGGPARAERR